MPSVKVLGSLGSSLCSLSFSCPEPFELRVRESMDGGMDVTVREARQTSAVVGKQASEVSSVFAFRVVKLVKNFQP